MQIYISGKISGLPLQKAKDKFQSAQELLEDLGLEVINPLNNGLNPNHDWKKQFVRNIENLLSCQAIYLLKDWTDSKRARIEKNMADEWGMDIWFESNVLRNQNVLLPIRHAIHEATGMSFKDYTTKSRKMDAFFARMIFVYHCRQNKMKLTDIAKQVNRDRTSMLHYLKKYKEEAKYNPHFGALTQRVDDLLHKTILL
ncbi:Chromosomal replication initiator protein DnaA [termite gut metagenome]|uniref:Chromosomal replication initiator protein DnaA n=1 Tax=termite gut metagenome TaxID=433724 RepID=A0A5J4R273_9ZZZZ